MRTFRPACWATALCALLLLPAGCGGGVSGTGAVFDPGQSTPTRLTTPDDRVSVLLPTDALTSDIRLTLLNLSETDAGVPGPEGRSLVMAMQFTGANPTAPPGSAGAGTGTAAPPVLSASVDVTLRLPFSLRSDISLPVYSYNDVSLRYEPAGLSGTPTPADPADTHSNELKFSITAFGRYAVYSLLPIELPPASPGNLRLLAASTQVRQLAWNAVSDPLVVGYNLYRADATQASLSYSKVNANAVLTVSTYSDELPNPGAFAYRVTSVNKNGLESDPSNVVDSPAVVFDVAFTFGTDTLDYPLALALDASRGRLVVADSALGGLHVYDLAGEYQQRVARYNPSGAVLDARGLGYNADYSLLYIADAAQHQCRMLDPQWVLAGDFGTSGTGPGEFLSPSAVVCAADNVLVADAHNSTLQAFTPQGVYLRTLATAGSDDGLLGAPSVLLLSAGGRLAIADTANDRVQLFKNDFTFEKLLDYPLEDGGPLVAPAGLAEDFRGRLYVSDTGNHRVVVFDSSGKFLFHFGADGALSVEFSTATGPQGLALDRATGYLYVCDPGNHRIAVFKT